MTKTWWEGALLVAEPPPPKRGETPKGNHILLALWRKEHHGTWLVVQSNHKPSIDTGQTDLVMAQRIAQVVARLES